MEKHLEEVVNKLWNAGGKIKTKQDEILNAVLGLAGESGEVADLHKKMFYHKTKDGRLDELKLELGDIMYYWLKVMDLYGWTVDEILELNREKLYSRYADILKERS